MGKLVVGQPSKNCAQRSGWERGITKIVPGQDKYGVAQTRLGPYSCLHSLNWRRNDPRPSRVIGRGYCGSTASRLLDGRCTKQQQSYRGRCAAKSKESMSLPQVLDRPKAWERYIYRQTRRRGVPATLVSCRCLVSSDELLNAPALTSTPLAGPRSAWRLWALCSLLVGWAAASKMVCE